MVNTATISTTLGAVIVALILPSGLSLLWHHWSGDPMLRPLGITQEALQDQEEAEGDALTIYAHINWDPTDPSFSSQDTLAQALTKGFSAKGLRVKVKMSSGSGGTAVTYEVGPSTMGPFPASNSAKGINAAVAAYRMNYPFEPE